MGIYIYKMFSLHSKSKSGLEKMKTILFSPVITSREMVQLTGEQRVFIVLIREHSVQLKCIKFGCIFNMHSYRVSQKNPKIIENDLLLEFQCLALN